MDMKLVRMNICSNVWKMSMVIVWMLKRKMRLGGLFGKVWEKRVVLHW